MKGSKLLFATMLGCFAVSAVPVVAEDLTYSGWKAGYAIPAGLSEEQADGITIAMNAVLGEDGSTVVKSFDQDPSVSAGFSSAATDPKGFYTSADFSSSDCTIVFGSLGSNGTATCPVTGETTKFGSPPSTYTVMYVNEVAAALLAANANATAANFKTYVDSLFTAMIDLSTDGDGVLIGDDTTGGLFGEFKVSASSGNWSFYGTTAGWDYVE